MKKIIIAFLTLCFILVGCSDIENNRENTNNNTEIDSESILSNYEKIKKIDADYLFENADKYKGENVMSVAIVGDISDNDLKLKTKKNEDALFFSFDLKCNNEDNLNNLNVGEEVCFVGEVGKKFSIGGCVDISNCEIVASGGNVSKYKSQLKSKKGKTNKKKKMKSNGKKEYIKSCKTYSYKNIKRNPDKYEDKKIKLTGKVIQIDEGWFDTVSMRIEDSNGNDWYVSYSYSNKEAKILEGDKITVYGECDGTEQYETIVGDTRRIPSIEAEYINR